MLQVRNQILALCCIAAFVSLGIFYYQTWVIQRPFGVILVVSDALTMENLAAAQMDGGKTPGIRSMTDVAIVNNLTRTGGPANPMAATIALSTGSKSFRTIDRIIRDAPRPGQTLVNKARRGGRSTGLVSNADITSHTVAPFYANVASARTLVERATVLAERAELDIVIGTGRADFLPVSAGGKREDGRDLFAEFRSGGYHVISNAVDLPRRAFWNVPRTVAVFDKVRQGSLEPGEPEGSITLANAVAEAVRALQYNRRGYLLIVSHVAGAPASASGTAGELARRDLLALDEVLKTARQYAGGKSLIVAVGRPKLNQRVPSEALAVAGGGGSEAVRGMIKDTDLHLSIASQF